MDTTTRPPLAQVADSAALLAALSTPSAGAEPISLVRVEYDRSGTPTDLKAYRKSGPVDGPEEIREVLLPHLRAQPARKQAFGFWIARTEDPSPALQFARFRQECAPVLLDREKTARLLHEAYQKVRARKRNARLNAATAQVRFYIDAQGEPTEVKLQKRTGNVDLDIEALRIARDLRFLPARLDEYAVGVWITMPLRFYTM